MTISIAVAAAAVFKVMLLSRYCSRGLIAPSIICQITSSAATSEISNRRLHLRHSSQSDATSSTNQGKKHESKKREENAESLFMSRSVMNLGSGRTTQERADGQHPITPRSFWVDTDVSFDDLVALKSLFRSTDDEYGERVELRATSNVVISTVGGVNTVDLGTTIVHALFPSIAIIPGKEPPLLMSEEVGDQEDADDIMQTQEMGTMMKSQSETIPLPKWLVRNRSSLQAFAAEVSRSSSSSVSHLTMTDAESVDATNRKHNADEGSTTEKDGKLQIWSTFTKHTMKSNGQGGFDLICLGPLTNIADWILHLSSSRKSGGEDSFDTVLQEWMNQIDTVWIMGGTLPVTDETAEAEFNFAQDPYAAHVAIHHFAEKVRIVPLDVCDDMQERYGKSELYPLMEQHATPDFQRLVAFDNKAIVYDPVCTFCYNEFFEPRRDEKQEEKTSDESMASSSSPESSLSCSFRQYPVRIDPNTGVVLAAKVDDEEAVSVQILTSLDVANGYIPWLLDLVSKK